MPTDQNQCKEPLTKAEALAVARKQEKPKMITKEQILAGRRAMQRAADALDSLYGDIVKYPYYQETNRSADAQSHVDRRLKEIQKAVLQALKPIKPKSKKKATV